MSIAINNTRQISQLEKAVKEFASELFTKTYNCSPEIKSAAFLKPDVWRTFTFAFMVFEGKITKFHDFSTLIKERITSALNDFEHVDVSLVHVNATIAASTIPVIRNCMFRSPTIEIDRNFNGGGLDFSSLWFSEANDIRFLIDVDKVQIDATKMLFPQSMKQLFVKSNYNDTISTIELAHDIVFNSTNSFDEVTVSASSFSMFKDIEKLCGIIGRISLDRVNVVIKDEFTLPEYDKLIKNVGKDASSYEIYAYCLEHGYINVG